MLKPTVDDPSKAKDPKSSDPARVSIVREKIKILIEGPLFLTSDLFGAELIGEQARLLYIVHRHIGVFRMLRASQIT